MRIDYQNQSQNKSQNQSESLSAGCQGTGSIVALDSAHQTSNACIDGQELLRQLNPQTETGALKTQSGYGVALAIREPVALLSQLAQACGNQYQVSLLNPNLPESQQIAIASHLGCRFLLSGDKHIDLETRGTVPVFPRLLTFCSSGTSSPVGLPKRFTFRLQQCLENARAHMASLGFDRSQRHRILLPLPINHGFGMVAGVLGSIQYNADLLLTDPGLSAQGILQAARQQNADSLYLTPAQVVQINTLLQRKPQQDKPVLQRISIGAAPLLARDLLSLMSHFPDTDFYTTYGLTELGPRVATYYAGKGSAPKQTLLDQADRVVPLGTPLPGISINTWDQRLWIKSPWQATNLNQGRIDFFNTQDYCEQDEDGQIRVPGRADDTIIRAGINIYPHEIEACLDEIDELHASCMIGIPSRTYGQVPVLVCQVENSDDSASMAMLEQRIQSCLGNSVAATHLPARIVFRDSLPRTSLGKIQRRVLQQEIAEQIHG